MASDNYKNEVLYCPKDDECRIYCNICAKLCIERFYTKHLKSQTHTHNIHKRQQLIKTIRFP